MPFFLIPTALGVSFFLIWAFIGGMMFRDSQLTVQRDLDSEAGQMPRYLSPESRAAVRPAKGRSMRRRRPQLVS